jgi:uncharacterized membrane protein YfcA
MIVLGFGLAALIGLSLGLLGGGGSILTVPILVYVLGFEAKPAIAMSLAVVGATALVGAWRHGHAGNVDWRVAALFGGVAAGGTFLGARVAVLFSGAAQLTLFAVVMLAAALFMFRDRTPAEGRRGPTGTLAAVLIGLEGLAVGVLTGLVGVGGGFLIVPALVLLARMPMKRAVGTSLLVIAVKSFAGFLGYLDQVSVPWGFLSGFTGVAIGGILAGTRLIRYVSQQRLKQAFAVFLIVMGIFILYRNRTVFLPAAVEARPAAPDARS